MQKNVKIAIIVGGLLVLGIGYMVWGNLKYADQPTDVVPAETSAGEATNLAYVASESNFKNEADGTMTWSVEVSQADAKTLRPVAGSTQGVVITVEARDSLKKTTYTATVGEDNWARWNTPTPAVETKLYLMDIKGELDWAAADRQFASTHSILSWKKELGPK